MTHTPGPWKYHPQCAYGWDIYSGDVWVGQANGPHGGRDGFPVQDDGMANVRLIAAAPDLLAALGFVWAQIETAEFENIEDDDDLVLITITARQARSIRAVVHQARGQT